MERWKINLGTLWLGQFFTMGGFTMIMPFLPLYLQELGMTDQDKVALWASVIFAANFATAFLFQPLWGNLSDRYGSKVMLLRSGIGMAVVMTLMGFAGNAWHLLLLRMLNGVVAGFGPAATVLISRTTPRDKVGFAMGVLQSGGVTGTIMGPLIGGLLADRIGFRPIFYVTGILLLAATLLALFFVKETFNREQARLVPRERLVHSIRTLWKIPSMAALFSVTFLLQFAMISPTSLVPLFVQDLHGQAGNIAFLAGFVNSVTGLSNMMSSPLLGRLSDRLGPARVLAIALLGTALMFIPQAFVTSVWQLVIVRFLLGVFMGGLLPSVNALIRTLIPRGVEGRAYSLNHSIMSLANLIGPIVGGALAGLFSIRSVFLFSGTLLLINFLWLKKVMPASRASHETESE